MTSNDLVPSLALGRLAPARLALSALGLLFAVGGCTTTGVEDLPDVVILLDGGDDDAGMDAGFPDPVVDTCVDPGGTLGTTCSEDAECDDGCYCNGVEACTGGECVVGTDPYENEVGPDTGAPLDIACTDEACLEETNACFHMPNHAVCSDGLACNGYEQCDRRMGCVAAPPLYCNDERSSPTSVDSCDDSMGCVFTPRDLDGDGFVAGTPCGGEDCDDDPRYGTEIDPGAVEVCDNRRDDDCDGRRDYNDSGDCIPTDNTCDAATILPARSGTYSGSTATLTSNYPLACSSGSMAGRGVPHAPRRAARRAGLGERLGGRDRAATSRSARPGPSASALAPRRPRWSRAACPRGTTRSSCGPRAAPRSTSS